MKCHQHLERNCGTFETIFEEKKVVCQFFDGFTFRTFGGLFEAIFYEEKVVRQFFAGFTNFRTFGETYLPSRLSEAIFYEKKLVLQFF